jgi:putative ABC transport system permease protein
MLWLLRRTLLSSPRRLLLAAIGAALPVASVASTLLFVDDGVRAMTRVALQPVQVEMRAVATSLDVDMAAVAGALQSAPGVAHVDRFESADVVLSAAGSPERVAARLFAVDPSYLAHHRWLHASGDLAAGALLDMASARAPDLAGAREVSVDLPTGSSSLDLTLPVTGEIDLSDAASTWFAIPAGDVQGDVAVIPRAIVVSHTTFERAVLPGLRAAYGRDASAINPALSELPAVSLEAHLSVDHRSYPSDPGRAAAWSSRLRRALERRAPAEVVVADNAAEPLAEAGVDATNAKMMFLLLGTPAVVVAVALGLAVASALAGAHRREEALLRLRGASDTQLAHLQVGYVAVAGALGTALGLIAATVGVAAVVRHPVWRDIPPAGLVAVALVAVAVGSTASVARLVLLVRHGRTDGVGGEPRPAAQGSWPWRRARLGAASLAVGGCILGVSAAAGGLKPTPVQGQALALSFYVLLAPLALWVGATVLTVEALLAALHRWSRFDAPRPIVTWTDATMRWLARRPARAGAALVLGALAVAFGTEVSTFVATYRSAKQADARAAFGSDLRLTQGTDRAQYPPDLGGDVMAVTPVRSVPARLGSDRKTIMAVDVSSYRAAVTSPPQVVRGGGLDGLAGRRNGVLVAQEIAATFAVSPGDVVPVVVFPDDPDRSRKLELHVVGVFRAFPPTSPVSEMVVRADDLPAPVPPADAYLARIRPGRNPLRVAAGLRHGRNNAAYSVDTITDRIQSEQRGLTALNLDGLGRIETAVAAVVASVGVGVLGAFMVLDRRREFAILRTVGAGTRDVIAGPGIEGGVTAVLSLLVGVPVGLGLGVTSVRVLGLFFAVPPPLLTVPVRPVATLAVMVLATSAAALGTTLRRVSRIQPAQVLREP